MGQTEEGYDDFAAALVSGRVDRLAAFPKTDLHCHSLLGASLQSIQSWAGVPLESPPVKMRSFDEMREYSHRVLYPVIYNLKGFQFTADRSIVEAIADGVRILEMSIDVKAHGHALYGRPGGPFLGSAGFRPARPWAERL